MSGGRRGYRGGREAEARGGRLHLFSGGQDSVDQFLGNFFWHRLFGAGEHGLPELYRGLVGLHVGHAGRAYGQMAVKRCPLLHRQGSGKVGVQEIHELAAGHDVAHATPRRNRGSSKERRACRARWRRTLTTFSVTARARAVSSGSSSSTSRRIKTVR